MRHRHFTRRAVALLVSCAGLTCAVAPASGAEIYPSKLLQFLVALALTGSKRSPVLERDRIWTHFGGDASQRLKVTRRLTPSIATDPGWSLTCCASLRIAGP